MLSSVPRRHALRTSLAVSLLVLGPLLAACSSDDAAPPASSAPPGSAGTAPGSTVELSAEQRLAEAKTVAVGFFEAQAVNDYDRALERSQDAASLTIEWARAVNGIAAANDSGYQVPTVDSPNVRVQIDALTDAGAGVWDASGFVELSFRPGPVASTTTTTAATPASTTPASPSTFIVDLSFVEDGATLRLADYRLDDLPYPVSQLFMALDTPEQSAGGLTGQATLGHRDLDGSVQYVVALTAEDAEGDATWRSAFTPAPEGSPPGTAVLPIGPDTVEGTTFADPVPAGSTAAALAVFPGAFPGTAGTLTFAGPAATTTTGAPTGSTPATAMNWALPAFPELTPRPTNTVEASTTSTTSSSTTTSSTTTSTPASSTPSTSAPATTSTTTATTRPPTTTTAPSSTTTSTTAG